MHRTPAILISLLCAASAFQLGCEADYHTRKVRRADDADRLTVGTVQREISRGMAASQVLEALGSPNIVSTDENSNEVWVYDRMATEVTGSSSRWFVTAGSVRRTQRTLTVIVKFDADKRVRDLAYHSSQF